MRIGIDFDNTIVDYTGIFYRAALKRNWIPKEVGNNKSDVRQYFIKNNNERQWTTLQSIVYGEDIKHAAPYPYVKKIIDELITQGHTLYIISHKTQFPIIGEKLNFHTAALNWLKVNKFITLPDAPFKKSDVFFNETIEDKINCIKEKKCDVFIDDLPKIFESELFPSTTNKILFDPYGYHKKSVAKLNKIKCWSEFNSKITMSNIRFKDVYKCI